VTRWRALAGFGVGVAAALGVSGLSRAARHPDVTSDGLLRVTLSARPERIERCRRLSESELAERPAHMRLALECKGGSATYRLRVWRDSVLLDDRILRGSGFRHDRPIHLLREYPVPSGERDLRVALQRVEEVPVDSAAFAMEVQDTGMERSSRETAERLRLRMEALPPGVEWRGRLVVQPRRVVLVRWDPVARELTAGDM
jgi:hypothetical protein